MALDCIFYITSSFHTSSGANYVGGGGYVSEAHVGPFSHLYKCYRNGMQRDVSKREISLKNCVDYINVIFIG